MRQNMVNLKNNMINLGWMGVNVVEHGKLRGIQGLVWYSMVNQGQLWLNEVNMVNLWQMGVNVVGEWEQGDSGTF